MVRATIPTGKYAGTHAGKVTVRQCGKFAIKSQANPDGVSYRYCRIIHHADGYTYSREPSPNTPATLC